MQVQPAPPPKLPGSTPMTPSYPPRPPISALPQPCPDSASPATLKHPLPQPAQQGPPNKQVRHKAFPTEKQAAPSTSMASPSAVDMSRMSAPSPKGPPASFLPTPGDVQQMSSCAAAEIPSKGVRWHTRSDLHLTSIGVVLSKNSLNLTSQEVPTSPSRFRRALHASPQHSKDE